MSDESNEGTAANASLPAMKHVQLAESDIRAIEILLETVSGTLYSPSVYLSASARLWDLLRRIEVER